MKAQGLLGTSEISHFMRTSHSKRSFLNAFDEWKREYQEQREYRKMVRWILSLSLIWFHVSCWLSPYLTWSFIGLCSLEGVQSGYRFMFSGKSVLPSSISTVCIRTDMMGCVCVTELILPVAIPFTTTIATALP